MSNAEPDWRLRDQETYLRDAALVRKPYRAFRENWEHDHCEFCWAKFMDPTYSEDHRTYIQEHPEVLLEGYATAADGSHEADDHWICSRCFDDFAYTFGWRVVGA